MPGRGGSGPSPLHEPAKGGTQRPAFTSLDVHPSPDQPPVTHDPTLTNRALTTPTPLSTRRGCGNRESLIFFSNVSLHCGETPQPTPSRPIRASVSAVDIGLIGWTRIWNVRIHGISLTRWRLRPHAAQATTGADSREAERHTIEPLPLQKVVVVAMHALTTRATRLGQDA